MSTVLSSEHFETILNFSRKISKGVNADDLSQHVIFRLLNEPDLLTKHLMTQPKALNVWLYKFISVEYSLSWSVFNRHFHNSYNKGREVIDLDIKDCGWIDGHKKIRCLSKDVGGEYDLSIDAYNLVKTSGLTDIERMYLNAYIDSGYNYRRCSDNLDIHHSTIKRHVKRAFDKCRDII